MDNEKFEDRELEEWLKSIPKPQDPRSREDVLARLNKDPRLSRRKRAPRRWIPAAVAAAAILTFGALIASLSGGFNESADKNSSGQDAAVMTRESSEQADRSGDSSQESDRSDLYSSMESGPSGSFADAVYPDQSYGFKVFTVGLTDQAVAIPVTFLIPEEKLKEDFDGIPDQVDLYNRYAAEIDEAALGFDEYHPIEGTVVKQGGDIVVTLPEKHPYDLSGAAVTVFTDVLKETFPDSSRIIFENDAGTPAQFGQIGEMEPVKSGGNNGIPYFAFEKADGTVVMAPDYGEAPADPAEALRLMQNPPNDLFEPVIPEDANFTAELPENGGDVLTVRFEHQYDFAQMNPEQAVRMIDGMALSAAGAGLRILFANAENGPDGYDLSAPIPIPSGPNAIVMNMGD
ncbi:hypothetical protein [Edaphobacillus lindanitolerans]|uniref:Sporulation and spore germination n=1 Tax=Edaphobacillus lindanitolerans TaxID=550447 RepID=A0A1U7PKM9_9BACI|nr:hypothetical protein [Edaphobacillus lindanitolerans]SIT66647.1 hypothetical protein SAMN05428946_0109 [Edaphobacillus lindanitolerans]